MLKLLFKNPELRPGLNVTVRDGIKWFGYQPGTRVEICETGREDVVIAVGEILHTAVMPFCEIPQAWLDREHAQEARTRDGLHAAMDRAYGSDNWGPEVTVVLFEVVATD